MYATGMARACVRRRAAARRQVGRQHLQAGAALHQLGHVRGEGRPRAGTVVGAALRMRPMLGHFQGRWHRQVVHLAPGRAGRAGHDRPPPKFGTAGHRPAKRGPNPSGPQVDRTGWGLNSYRSEQCSSCLAHKSAFLLRIDAVIDVTSDRTKKRCRVGSTTVRLASVHSPSPTAHRSVVADLSVWQAR